EVSSWRGRCQAVERSRGVARTGTMALLNRFRRPGTPGVPAERSEWVRIASAMPRDPGSRSHEIPDPADPGPTRSGTYEVPEPRGTGPAGFQAYEIPDRVGPGPAGTPARLPREHRRGPRGNPGADTVGAPVRPSAAAAPPPGRCQPTGQLPPS